MTQATRSKHRTADRQAELVQAALQLAALHSPAGVTTAALAEVIGITQGGVFKHFESKEAIWLAVLDWTQHTLLQRLQAATQRAEANKAPLEALRAVFMEHVAFVQEYPGVPRLIFQELQYSGSSPLKTKVQVLMQEYRQLVSGLLMQLQGTRHSTPSAKIQAAAVLFIGAVQGLVMQSLISGDLSGTATQAAKVYEIYEAGLLAAANSQPRKPS